MRLRDHSALVLAFAGLILFQKVDREWRIGSSPGPPHQCTQIVLPPVERSDDGFIKKAAEPHTNDLGAWALFLDGRVEGPFTFRVTAYNEHDGHTPGTITASGLPVMEGITAACGSGLELGQIVVLENGMVVRCLDRGWLDPWGVDIYFDTLEEAQQFGVQEIRGVVVT